MSRTLAAGWWLALIVGAVLLSSTSKADLLTFLSDTITNSAPGESGSHTIQFTTTNTIPASGKITIEFESGGITNLASLNFLDVDIASASDYALAAAPSGGTLGVTFTGSAVSITLGNTPITAGTVLTVELGTIATFGATGDTSLINGATTGDYTVTVTSKTSADVSIDSNQTVFVLIPLVGLDVGTPTPTVGGGGGGGSSPTPTPLPGLQFWPDANPNPGAFGSRVLGTSPVSVAETAVSAIVTNSGSLTQLGIGGTPISFTTITGIPAAAVISAGAWDFQTYAMATDAGGYTSLTARVLIRHTDGTEVLLFEHQITSDLASTPTAYTTSTYQPEFTILPTDQLVLRYFTQTGSSAGSVTVTVYYQGTLRYSNFGAPPYTTPLPSCFRIADFNGDCRVNIVDFSILMANWGQNPRNPLTDINADNSAGIVDLSILLYWWTG